jgi:hypothetical protein
MFKNSVSEIVFAVSDRFFFVPVSNFGQSAELMRYFNPIEK